MSGGYMGKMLFVDLSNRRVNEEIPDEKLYKDFLGGYGIGARIIYSRQKSGVDPLGPENIFAVLSGILAGTPATMSNRYTAMAKSPLTLGWGDANSGGSFGPYLKFAGYDGVFFTGISEKPVYLLMDNDKAELKDASHLWGKGNYDTEEMLQDEHGKDAKVISIGPAGEKISLISCIITERGAAAGRSGLGAVMGSKRLKAVVAKGSYEVPVVDRETMDRIRKEKLVTLKERKMLGYDWFEAHHTYGTALIGEGSAYSGSTPVKNWDGVGVVDFADASGLSGEAAIANLDRRVGCWHCPIGCEALLKEGKGEYKYPAGTRRPEYETQGTFGTMCLNNNTESIAMANHICNDYGLDTISAGCTVAFAIECYERGIINKADTDGIELSWGNHRSIVALTEKMAKREGFGDILADGSKKAAERIGKETEQFSVQIDGQELGMHDPKAVGQIGPDAVWVSSYQLDPTPGRHTQHHFGPSSFIDHVANATGLCIMGVMGVRDCEEHLKDSINAVTGWNLSLEDVMRAGERILNIRHAFNLREGINPLNRKVHDRILGNPPQKEGPLAGVTVDPSVSIYWNLGALDWDAITTKPSKNKLLELGLNDIADDLWPS